MNIPGSTLKAKAGFILLALVGAVIVLPLASPFAIVPAGTRGVMTTFGKITDEVYTEGLHWRWPIAQEMHLVEVRVQKGEGQGDAASKDLQSVQTSVGSQSPSGLAGVQMTPFLPSRQAPLKLLHWFLHSALRVQGLPSSCLSMQVL